MLQFKLCQELLCKKDLFVIYKILIDLVRIGFSKGELEIKLI